jgi:hypothetical protein
VGPGDATRSWRRIERGSDVILALRLARNDFYQETLELEREVYRRAATGRMLNEIFEIFWCAARTAARSPRS